MGIKEYVMEEPIKSTRVIDERTAVGSPETVADILERQLDVIIQEWLARVEKEPDLTAIPLNYQERTGHLPQLLHDVIRRLRMDEGTKAPISEAAAHHGDLRSKQGYTVAMAVEESRLLQVSIFSTLHKSENHLEFSAILPAVVTIADEVDAQLKQQMLRFMAADVVKAAKAAKAA
jgi:RsbT co-antagonist protein rsbRD N-terminal domain